MRTVVKTGLDCVEQLVSLADEHEVALPATSLHVLALAEAVAGLTLRAVRRWPEPQADRGADG